MPDQRPDHDSDSGSQQPDAEKSRLYWSQVDATVNGMLGGFSRVSPSDISESRKFLSHFFSARKSATTPLPPNRTDPLPCAKLALDCGAGIGRITKLLLLHFADEVHLLEQCESFLNQSLEYIGLERKDRVKQICASLQSFEPESHIVYDIIWLQWVTGYLTDDELIAFLVKVTSCLTKQGMIFVKDNTVRGEEIDADMNDHSVTRPKSALLSIFESANLSVIRVERQKKLPRGLYPVYMFALRPKDRMPASHPLITHSHASRVEDKN